MKLCMTIALMLANLLGTCFAQSDVTYFRSDHGVSGDTRALPDNFSTDAQMVWRCELPPGHSTPCVISDRVIVTTYQAEAVELATVCVHRQTGEVLWKRVVPTKTIEPVHASGNPATSTPASDGKNIYVFFGSYGLLCYDLNGTVLWEKKMGPFQDEFGAASSPILVDGKIILNEDHDIDSFLMAIDAKSGATVWKVERPEATRSYSTPLVIERDGKKEILVAGSLQLAAYDPQSGEKLWWFNGLSRIVDTTPVVHDGLIYVATWTPGGDAGERITMEPFADALAKFDKNQDGSIERDELPKDSPVLDRFFRIDLNQNQQLDGQEWARHAEVFERAQNVAVALEPGTRGSLDPRYVKWTYSRGLPTVPSSVVYKGMLTMVKDSGIMTILDIQTGKLVHQGRAEGRGNYYASLVAGDGKVYLTSESGVVTVLAAGAESRILGSHDFGERIMATPVIANGQIFVRSAEALYCFIKK